MFRRTKIVATVGPASSSEGMLLALMEAGADVFRLNFSHGDQAGKVEVIRRIRALSTRRRIAVAILGDLQGPKLRTGLMEGGSLELRTGEEVAITVRDVKGAGNVIPTSYHGLPGDVAVGETILLDDGLLELKVLSVGTEEVRCRVVVGGMLRDRKGINLPGSRVSIPALTEKDRQDVAFCIEQQVDYLALSFVRSAADIIVLKDLLAARDVAVTTGTTAANRANLAPGFFETMQARFGGTRLGRQELDAELIEDNDAALWTRDWIEAGRVAAAPALSRIVVAIDPPASSHGDECGIVIAGRDDGDHAYVLADRSASGLSPAGWARRAIDAYEDFEADGIVAEANQGGDMVAAVLAQEMAHAPVRLVHATRAKRTRAEPAAARYERGLVHHAGRFPELEDQLCQYDGTGSSPDRLDALVWALADLFPPTRRATPKVRPL